MAYRKKFDNGDSFSARFIGSWLRSRDFFTDPTAPLVPNRARSELGDPEFEFSLSLAYQSGPVGIRYSGRYIGKQTIGTYEAQNPYIGACLDLVLPAAAGEPVLRIRSSRLIH